MEDVSMASQEAIPLSHLPIVRLHVRAHPSELGYGLAEIKRHHIHKHLLEISPTGNLLPADGTTQYINASTSRSLPVWNWNVEIVSSSSQNPHEWSCRTSSATFAPYDPTGDLEVQEPFGIQITYREGCIHTAFRALGHVLSVSRQIMSRASTSEADSLHPNLFASPLGSASVAPRSLYLSPTKANTLLNTSQAAQFETIGTMIDCSRNGVLNVPSVKFLLTRLALLGYNMLQLYTEDTYEINNEPFFGYMRGAYTHDELKEIDDYANRLGIEVIPCIQTLGHLGQMLQWPRYLGLRDTAEVLLAEAPETYAMLQKMIQAASAPFRSKKIHLGMDETHGLAHGRYYSIYGHQNGKTASQVFAQHLARVTELCQSMQLLPSIWSDMLFCLSARNNSLTGYYDSDRPVDEDVKNAGGIPPGVDLVYWDYYHTQASSYQTRIKSHEQLRGASPWVASGSWTWSRFWTALPFTFQTTAANLEAAKQCPNVRHVMMTIWGDEGNEVDLWSSLPAWIFYAEQAYSPSTVSASDDMLSSKFDALVGGNWDDFVLASRLDDTSHSGTNSSTVLDDKIHFAPNTSKWMLWQDPVHSFVEPTLVASGFDAEEHYRQLARTLADRVEGVTMDLYQHEAHPSSSTGLFGTSWLSGSEDYTHSRVVRILQDHPFNARLQFPRLLATTLSYKANLRQRLHETYMAGKWSELRTLHKRLKKCRDSAERCWHYHRQMWMSMYKPQGWETLELRYGGLVSRLDTLYCRIQAFLTHLSRGGKVGVSLKAQDTNASAVFLPSMLSDDADNASSTDSSSMDDDDSGSSVLDDDSDEDFRNSRRRRRAARQWQEEVYRLEELEKPLHVVYGSAEQLLDYHRVSRPTYC